MSGDLSLELKEQEGVQALEAQGLNFVSPCR